MSKPTVAMLVTAVSGALKSAHSRTIQARAGFVKLTLAHYYIAIIAGGMVVGSATWAGLHFHNDKNIAITKSGVKIADREGYKSGQLAVQTTIPGTTTGASSGSGSSAGSKTAGGKPTNGSTTATPNSSARPQPQGYKPSGGLVASPSKVTFSPNALQTYVTISSTSDTAVSRPEASTLPGLMTFVEYGNAPTLGGAVTQKSWQLTITRLDFNSKGQDYITVKNSSGHSTSILVTWSPAPTFNLLTGDLARSDNNDTITHTAHFAIAPNNPYFGNPTLTIRLYGNVTCLNSNELTRTFVYDGQNSFTMSCVVRRIPPHVPGTYPPPLPSSATFSISVSGMVNGEFIRGPYPITYILPSGYDR